MNGSDQLASRLFQQLLIERPAAGLRGTECGQSEGDSDYRSNAAHEAWGFLNGGKNDWDGRAGIIFRLD